MSSKEAYRDAKEEGYEANKQGMGLGNNPYLPLSELYVAWIEGWWKYRHGRQKT